MGQSTDFQPASFRTTGLSPLTVSTHCQSRRRGIELYCPFWCGPSEAEWQNDLHITGPIVSIVLTGKRRSRRVAEYVASELDSTVDELWPGVYSNGEDRA